MKKWLLAMLLILCLPFQTSAATTFSDVSPHTEVGEAVAKLVERGIISGYQDGTYRPSQVVTRGQAAKILAGVLKLDTKNSIAYFSDVPDSYEHYSPIAALAERKILSGYADGTFKPNNPITRGQMAKILSNAFHFTGMFHTLPFSDVPAGSETSGYINALYSYAITTGTTATTFSPGSQVTRGQLAVFITRAENSPKQGLVVDVKNHGMTAISDWMIESDHVKVVASGNEIHLLPVKAGTTRLLISGPSTFSTIQQTVYKLYTLSVQNDKGLFQLNVTDNNLIEGLSHNVHFYTYDSLQLGFIPTGVSVKNVYGETVPADSYYIGRAANGIEVSIYLPGRYTLTLSGDGKRVSFDIAVTIKQFETVPQLSSM